MAKKSRFSLDFDGFLDFANKVDQLGEGYLKLATENALTKSKDFVNNEIENAMNASPYNFNGQGYSKGKSKKSLNKVAAMPVVWTGTVAKAYIGPNLSEAPQALILGYGVKGTPHLKGDTKLLNALKVKGKIRKQVSEIQQQEFQKVIAEGMRNG